MHYSIICQLARCLIWQKTDLNAPINCRNEAKAEREGGWRMEIQTEAWILIVYQHIKKERRKTIFPAKEVLDRHATQQVHLNFSADRPRAKTVNFRNSILQKDNDRVWLIKRRPEHAADWGIRPWEIHGSRISRKAGVNQVGLCVANLWLCEQWNVAAKPTAARNRSALPRHRGGDRDNEVENRWFSWDARVPLGSSLSCSVCKRSFCKCRSWLICFRFRW